jgi:hypothetical protein
MALFFFLYAILDSLFQLQNEAIGYSLPLSPCNPSPHIDQFSHRNGCLFIPSTI